MVCKCLQRDARSTEHNCLINESLGLSSGCLRRSRRSAAVGKQTNTERWIMNSRRWNLHQWAACCLLSSPRPIHHPHFTSHYMLILTKIPNPHRQQAEWPKRPSSTSPQNSQNQFSLRSARPQRRLKCISLKICNHKTLLKLYLKLRVRL